MEGLGGFPIIVLREPYLPQLHPEVEISLALRDCHFPLFADFFLDIIRQILKEFVPVLLYGQHILVPNDNVFEAGVQFLEGTFEVWVQRALKRQFVSIFVAEWQRHVLYERTPHLVVHGACLGIADPTVDATTPGEDPEDVLDVEVLLEDLGDELRGEAWKRPASLANLGARAALSDIVIGVHINIEDYLLLLRHEGLLVGLQVSLRRDIVHGAQVDLVRHATHKCRLELLSGLETQVPAVDVVGEGEGEFAVEEVV